MSSKLTALDAASKYLSKRMHTEAEVKKRLIEKEYDKEEIVEAIDELKRFRYIDDYQYCLRFIEYSYEKSRAAIRIKAELVQRGVESYMIEEAYEEYCEAYNVNEFNLALKYAEGLCMNGSDVSIDEKLIKKISRGLESRGFGPNDIYRVVGEMYKWKDSREQND
ncbi:MAG: regulatory protein RecX [Peptostreptococcaceae bacterium]|nr:regulatory protein RecX [Peptostreptococcaceae bacterium]